jgi:hypothetical protein
MAEAGLRGAGGGRGAVPLVVFVQEAVFFSDEERPSVEGDPDDPGHDRYGFTGYPRRIRSSTVEPAISDLALRIVTGLPSRPSVRTCEVSSPGMTAGMTNCVLAGRSGR